ncbi:hypothetical protein CPB84DRAFT_1788680 [Gymnopilus junonius]|uniref:Hydrophobin n=1 Tax=Gymnopilus junonius TaxID=109634 RepID=A0A9P5NFT3_GYMJU|nr:hypothetical protein CPB84DRAFT_1788680 [Gymnopilus junonius]
MFSPALYTLFLTLPAFVVATILPRGGIVDSCNTGGLQCCKSIQAVSHMSHRLASFLVVWA